MFQFGISILKWAQKPELSNSQTTKFPLPVIIGCLVNSHFPAYLFNRHTRFCLLQCKCYLRFCKFAFFHNRPCPHMLSNCPGFFRFFGGLVFRAEVIGKTKRILVWGAEDKSINRLWKMRLPTSCGWDIRNSLSLCFEL